MKTTFCILTIFFLSVLSNQLLAQDHALDFKGSDGYVYCMNLFVSGNAPRTVEAWVNPRTFKSNAGVFECGHGASGSGLINFGLRMGNSNEWKVELHDETLIYNSTGTLNTWNHFALVYDGTNVKLYHNGNLVINVARNINTIQSSFLIGRLASGFFDGKIDEVRFWNVARSQAQIQSAMYTELAGNEDGLLAEYRMNEGAGTTALNSSTRSDLNSYYNNYKSAEIRYDASWDYGFTTSFVPPTVATQAVTAITTTTATGNGNVTNLGVPNPTQYGVCWSTTANPTTTLSTRTEQGAKSATGAFTSSITNLTPGTTYHVRAYATNDAGTSYGDDVQFTAFKTPTVTTQAVTSITSTTAIGNGNVTYLGVPNPTQYGVCWNTSGNPTTADSKKQEGSKSATGAFTSSITGLSGSTTYYVRAYTTNTAGTSYGEQVQFTTLIAGDGTQGNPYQITNLNDLLWIYNNSTKWNCSFIQTNDIDASSTSGWNLDWKHDATGWMPIGNETIKFTGLYDGNGHVISGLYINRGSSNYQALFGIINGATIKNLKLTDVSIQGSEVYTGGLAGSSDNYSQINNCSVSGNVKGSYHIGALVGCNNTNSSISNCFTTGSVSATGGEVGGLTANNHGTISNCYSTASVSANSNTGGLTSANSGTISNCYSIGYITPSNCSGGLCGANLSGCTIINSFWNTETSCKSTSAGGGTGKTTAEMKLNTLYINAGWDLNIWNMGDGINDGYPYLKWQNPVGPPLPVELSSFTAAEKNNKVILNWKTETEVNNYGFEVERGVRSSEFRVLSSELGVLSYEKIGFVAGAGNSNGVKEYLFTDNTVKAGRYSYRLKQIDNDGTYKYSGETEVTIVLPKEFALNQNYPNPFNPTTTIKYDIAEGSQYLVTLRVFDIAGREVATLVNEVKEPGRYTATFDASGFASGIYYCRLQAGTFTATKKLLLIK